MSLPIFSKRVFLQDRIILPVDRYFWTTYNSSVYGRPKKAKDYVGSMAVYSKKPKI